MKRVIFLSMIILVIFSSCEKSSSDSDYEIKEICKTLKLSTMTVQMDDVHIKKVKGRDGKEVEIVIKQPLDCKFSYDLKDITVKNNVLTLPTCKVSIVPHYDEERKTTFYSDARITIDQRNSYMKDIKNDILNILNESRYKDKAFNYAEKLLRQLLIGESIEIRPNDKPLDIESFKAY